MRASGIGWNILSEILNGDYLNINLEQRCTSSTVKKKRNSGVVTVIHGRTLEVFNF
jgi:hypothetical protein